jgi:putative phage-type endonuclease
MTTTTTDDRTEWLAWRRDGIGASDIAGILGISPWASPFSIWADKTGLLDDDDLDEDDRREFGKRAEAMIGPWFEHRTGLTIAAEQVCLASLDHDWMRATPDGLVIPEPPDDGYLCDVLGPVEYKAVADKPWDQIPAHYQAQGQWQMAVGRWDRAWFAVLHGTRFRVYVLERDQADIDYMIERAEQFWFDHVVANVPPEIDGSDATAAAIKALYPETQRGETRPVDHVAGALQMLAEAKAETKAAETKANAAHSTLVWAMGDAEIGTVAGSTALTLKTQTRKTTCQHCGTTDESAPFRVLRPAKEFAS